MLLEIGEVESQDASTGGVTILADEEWFQTRRHEGPCVFVGISGSSWKQDVLALNANSSSLERFGRVFCISSFEELELPVSQLEVLLGAIIQFPFVRMTASLYKKLEEYVDVTITNGRTKATTPFLLATNQGRILFSFAATSSKTPWAFVFRRGPMPLPINELLEILKQEECQGPGEILDTPIRWVQGSCRKTVAQCISEIRQSLSNQSSQSASTDSRAELANVSYLQLPNTK